MLMNEKKIAFIICTNDDMWFDECVKYIEFLELPKDFEREIIKIVGAKSMASGYNEGMHSSDAKYKFYLHHDVFIIKRDFLQRVLNIFENNPDIGLLGVLGSNTIVETATYWDKWSLGQVYASSGASTMFLHSEKKAIGEYAPAVAVDGMLMMTQYDVEWREDLFRKWDFYDISQSFEFQRKGYKVAVILEKAEEASTFHDCGYSKLWDYDEWRRVFCLEYAEFGFKAGKESINNAEEVNNLVAQLMVKVNQFMQSSLENACLVVDKGFEILPTNNTIVMLRNIFQIYGTEREEQCRKCFIEIGDTWESAAKKYVKYKFLLRELEFDIGEDALNTLYNELRVLNVTIFALECILLRCCYDVEKVETKLLGLFEE